MVSKIGTNLKCDESECEDVWNSFLKYKLTTTSNLNQNVQTTLTKIFETSLRDPSKGSMKFSDLLFKSGSNFLAFLNGIKNRPLSDVRDDLRDFFNPSKVTMKNC
jgi:hypothetical protein